MADRPPAAADAIKKKPDLATFHPSVCNRLDRNTAGIVLCGKTPAGSQALSRIIKDRSGEEILSDRL